ncbi:MAG: YadA-like family protein [Phascolarctobacterium sp.]|nr:YadA-like family protein [Phascolarctobacterium sp.]
MKKNLAKRVVLGLLTGAVLMSSSVVWAENVDISDGTYSVYTFSNAGTIIGTSFGVGYSKMEDANEDINPGNITSGATNSIVIGINSHVKSANSVALGNNATVDTSSDNSVALGYGSIANASNVVSVGNGGATGGVGADYRKIVNVANGSISEDSHEAVTGGQLYNVKTSIETSVGSINNKIGDTTKLLGTDTNYVKFGSDLVGSVLELDNRVGDIIGTGLSSIPPSLLHFINNEDTLTNAIFKLDGYVYANQQAIADVIEKDGNGSITVNAGGAENPVTIDSDGITVGTNSARIDGSGFYVWDGGTHTAENAKASMTKDGKIKGASGKFEVGADGSVKAAGDKFKVDKDGNVTAEKITAKEVEAENLYTKAEIDEKLGGSNASVAGINQRLDKTNAKINKVGAGAAALAALHPLDYDPDDKLTFSAGMGNYAGENAAALGAFYRPNEKFMVSLGGTMGNGENMVNLGISIGLDKANGFAKMSKRELIQEVNAVKAENEAIKADNEAMKAEMAEMKAMLQELLAKK